MVIGGGMTPQRHSNDGGAEAAMALTEAQPQEEARQAALEPQTFAGAVREQWLELYRSIKRSSVATVLVGYAARVKQDGNGRR